MMASVHAEHARRIAGVELNALAASGTIDIDHFEGAEVGKEATPVHDINGEVLFYRVPVVRQRHQVAFVDIGAHEVLGDPLLAVSSGVAWHPDAIVGEAREHARRRDRAVEKTDEVRFVAYSYPKVAVQFLRDGREVAMVEWMTWEPVPRAGQERRDLSRQRDERRPLEPGSFERWSLIEEVPEELRRTRAESWERRLDAHLTLDLTLDPHVLRPRRWLDILVLKLVDTREVAYSLRPGDHGSCYELRGQETNVWCVGASAQMLLDFYRYPYTQVRLAQELGLGTLANPNGLPYSQVGHVITALEALTSNGLDVTMVTNPTFATFRDEIKANRPLISFVPGHSRTVAGYTESFIAPINQAPYRGLLVYDPWPPNAGVITRWENFATQTYQYAYTAKVGTIP